jgi:glycosidase
MTAAMTRAVTGWPGQPVIYEVNTAVWLDDRSRVAGRPLTLADVPDSDWDAITPAGVDAVWLMGVWERSPAGLALANANDELQASFRDALPDLRPEDVIGSPYCVHRYVVDDRFGGRHGLAEARQALARRGVRLILDYVPNHVAPDHPWVWSNPEFFVTGGPDDASADPALWLAVDGNVVAHGRDPYFPPWPDVVQLNAFSGALRDATTGTLRDISDQCDGIRCDMAMLMTNQVFERTWGGRVGPPPHEDFWPAVIAALRETHPETVLIAEAYWDMEWDLQQEGFNFCYDKRLYDRIVEGNPAGIRQHLVADIGYQSRLVRFLENHDEPRVASTIPRDLWQAAAVMVATLPGATMWHAGQFEGHQVRIPVFLARDPEANPLDAGLADWYRQFVDTISSRQVRTGEWQSHAVEGWPDNQSCENLLAWSWSGDQDAPRHLIVVNFSDAPAQGQVQLSWPDLPGRSWRLTDLIGDEDFERDGDELAGPGLFVSMQPGQSYLFSVR